MQAGTPVFGGAIAEVLSNPRYAKAAHAMSVMIKARKKTPVQEAAGECSLGLQRPNDASLLKPACP